MNYFGLLFKSGLHSKWYFYVGKGTHFTSVYKFIVSI